MQPASTGRQSVNFKKVFNEPFDVTYIINRILLRKYSVHS